MLQLGRTSDCPDDSCRFFYRPLLDQLGCGKYDWPVSVLELDRADSSKYLSDHRTARKRAQRARNIGYTFRLIERADHSEEIYEINTSLPERQGRPMAESYNERRAFTPLPGYPCPRHRIDVYGVFAPGGKLVAYAVVYVCGNMAMISQILGHGEHMQYDVMYLLVTEVISRLPKPIFVFYNRHDSGTDGLRYFKERLGFRPTRVRWAA